MEEEILDIKRENYKLRKENFELIQDNTKLQEKINLLEFKLKNEMSNEINKMYRNTINKDLIRIKIGELIEEKNKIKKKKLWNEPFDTIKNNKYDNCINILKELLGE